MTGTSTMTPWLLEPSLPISGYIAGALIGFCISTLRTPSKSQLKVTKDETNELNTSKVLYRHSNGLTDVVDSQTLQRWTKNCQGSRRLIFPQIGGALWVRFHMMNDVTAPVSLDEHFTVTKDIRVDSMSLIQFAFPSRQIAVLLQQCAGCIWELDIAVLPDSVVFAMIEEVLSERQLTSGIPADDTTVKRLMVYLTLLSILTVKKTGEFGVHVINYSRKGAFMSRTFCHSFLERLSILAATDNSILLVFPRICTQLRFYSKATELLVAPSVAQTRLSACISLRDAVSTWTDDIFVLVKSMEQGLVPLPPDFMRSSFSLLKHGLADQICDANADKLDVGMSLDMLGTAFLASGDWEEAGVCLGLSRTVLYPLLPESLRNVSNAIKHLSLVFAVRKEVEKSRICLVAAVDLSNSPVAKTLVSALKRVNDILSTLVDHDVCLKWRVQQLRICVEDAKFIGRTLSTSLQALSLPTPEATELANDLVVLRQATVTLML